MTRKQNIKLKKELEKIYGKKCMFTAANVEQHLIGRYKKQIKGYKQFKDEQIFKGRKLDTTTLTVHHLQHRSEGGSDSVKNTSLINATAHEYLHSLTREQEEFANNIIRKYKLACAATCGGKVLKSKIDLINFDISDDYISIPAYPNQKEKEKKGDNR